MNQLAKHIVDIATGQADDTVGDDVDYAMLVKIYGEAPEAQKLSS